MLTSWVLALIIPGGIAFTSPINTYTTLEKCQAQIDKLPEQARRTIAGDRFTCAEIIINNEP